MHFRISYLINTALALQAATSVFATPAPEVHTSRASLSTRSRHTSVRPNAQPYPLHPKNPPPKSPSRNKVCYVASHNDGVTDDSEYILAAIEKCNNGGHVVFVEGTEYLIGTALDLTFLKHIDLGKGIHNVPGTAR